MFYTPVCHLWTQVRPHDGNALPTEGAVSQNGVNGHNSSESVCVCILLTPLISSFAWLPAAHWHRWPPLLHVGLLTWCWNSPKCIQKKKKVKKKKIFCSFGELNWFSKSSSEHQGQHPCCRWEGGAGEQGVFLLAEENLVPELAQQTKPCAPQCCVHAKLCVCKETTGVELLMFQIKTSDQVYVCLT